MASPQRKHLPRRCSRPLSRIRGPCGRIPAGGLGAPTSAHGLRPRHCCLGGTRRGSLVLQHVVLISPPAAMPVVVPRTQKSCPKRPRNRVEEPCSSPLRPQDACSKSANETHKPSNRGRRPGAGCGSAHPALLECPQPEDGADPNAGDHRLMNMDFDFHTVHGGAGALTAAGSGSLIMDRPPTSAAFPPSCGGHPTLGRPKGYAPCVMTMSELTP